MALLSAENYIRKQDGLQWYLVRTMPRSENNAAGFFLRNSVPYYLPKINKNYVNSFTGANGKKYRYKRAPVPVPMFPGYIFAALDLALLSEARRERSIAQVCLHTTYNEDELIRDLNKVKEFEFLALNNQIELTQKIEIGMHVVVVRGPFEGWEGIVERRVDQNIIWILAETIGYSMGIEIAVADCEPLE